MIQYSIRYARVFFLFFSLLNLSLIIIYFGRSQVISAKVFFYPRFIYGLTSTKTHRYPKKIEYFFLFVRSRDIQNYPQYFGTLKELPWLKIFSFSSIN